MPGGLADTCRLGGDEGLEVDHVQKRRLQQLALEDRPLHADKRLLREDRGPLRHRIHIQAELEPAEVVQEGLLEEGLPVFRPRT